jgi:transcriptional regulator with XRE-family HTH domain
MITPLQVRMARAALGWGVRQLSTKAGVATNTVSRFENGYGAMVETLTRIQGALENAGVIFIAADQTGGPGVRLRESPLHRPRRKRPQ